MRIQAVFVLPVGALVAALAACQSQSHSRTAAQASVDFDLESGEAEEEAESAVVWLRCEDATPGHPCGLLIDDLASGYPQTGAIAHFVRQTCREDSTATLSANCFASIRRMFTELLRARYPRATLDEVERRCKRQQLPCEEDSGDALRLAELVYMDVHNERVRVERDNTITSLRERRDRAVRQAERERKANEDRRRVLAAIAAALQGLGATVQEGGSRSTTTVRVPPASTSEPSVSVVEPATCMNDYTCPYGSHCIKHQFQISGYCARTTDAMGVPTLAGPRPSSVYVGDPHQCQFNTDCPVGWRCDKGTGLFGACVK